MHIVCNDGANARQNSEDNVTLFIPIKMVAAFKISLPSQIEMFCYKDENDE